MNSVQRQVKSIGTPQARKGAENQSAVDALVFLIPCLQFIQIRLVGALSGCDLLLLGVFIYLAFNEKFRLATPLGRRFLLFGSLWLVSQCVTDIVRHSAFIDYARGWSNIGLTVVNFTVLYTLLYKRPWRLFLYGWGLAVGSVLWFLIHPTESMVSGDGNAWKFGWAYPATMAVFLIACSKQCSGQWPVILAAAIGVINMLLGARSMGGVCLAAALYLEVMNPLRGEGAEIAKLKAVTVIFLAGSILLSVVGVMWAYGYAASGGYLGEQAQKKYGDQASGQYGVLLGGRPELLSELPAIYDSPILGHGSWAKEPLYLIEEHESMVALGYKDEQFIDPDQLAEGQIPAHSYFFQAWVDGGILGAVFWGWVFVVTAKALTRIYPKTVELLPTMAFLAFLLLWNIPFSPFGTQERITFPYSFVVLMSCLGVLPAKAVRATVRKAKRKISPALTPRPQH